MARYSDIDIDGFRSVGDERLLYGLRDLNQASGWQARGGGLWGIRRDGSDQPSRHWSDSFNSFCADCPPGAAEAGARGAARTRCAVQRGAETIAASALG